MSTMLCRSSASPAAALQRGRSSVAACAAAPFAAARPRQQHAALRQHQQRQQQLASTVARATSKEDEMIEKMKREAEGNDIWGNELVATALKVGLVALIITVAVLLLDVAQPIVETTVERFPSPPQ